MDKLVDTKHKKNISKYEDIIYLKHHVSTKRPHMSMANRAAQFAPFAALTGFDEQIMQINKATNERE